MEVDPAVAEQRCSNCGSTELRQDTNGVWHCLYCRSTFRADDPAMIVVASPNVQQANENVIDTADMLTFEQQAAVSAHLRSLRDRHDVVVVVETVNTITENVEHYARRRAQELGVGDDVKDNGVFILMVRQPRRVQIQAGDGISQHLSSDDINRVVQESVIPAFKDGDYVAGLTRGADELVATYETNRGSGRTFTGPGTGSSATSRALRGGGSGKVFGWIVIGVIVVWVLFNVFAGQGLGGGSGSTGGGDSGVSWDIGDGGGSDFGGGDWGGGGSDFGGGDFGGGSGGGSDW